MTTATLVECFFVQCALASDNTLFEQLVVPEAPIENFVNSLRSLPRSILNALSSMPLRMGLILSDSGIAEFTLLQRSTTS